jgi:hypothetical protein
MIVFRSEKGEHYGCYLRIGEYFGVAVLYNSRRVSFYFGDSLSFPLVISGRIFRYLPAVSLRAFLIGKTARCKYTLPPAIDFLLKM